MTDRVKHFLDNETPQGVQVPDSWFSIVWWSFAKFGAGMVVAAFAFFWLVRIDERAAGREEKLLEAYLSQAAVQMRTAESLEAHTQTLERMIRQAEAAHRRQ